VILALILIFIVAPLVEFAVTFWVAHLIGWINTIALLILVSLLGAMIVGHQGLGSWARIRGALRSGVVPTPELVDGGLILVAGMLVLVPGFVTDVVGLVLLLPPVRHGVRALLRRHFAGRILVRDVRYRRPPTSGELT
jgi:UPF0716 protein FxsA